MELTTVENIVNDFCDALRANLVDTNASGKLSKSIKGVVKMKGKYITISISLEDYWKYIEYGTKPHFPPIDAIRKWIKVKPILPRPLANGKLPTENQLAYLIGRKISKVGTKAKPFLQPTIKEFDLVGKVYNEVLELVTKQITQEINEEL